MHMILFLNHQFRRRWRVEVSNDFDDAGGGSLKLSKPDEVILECSLADLPSYLTGFLVRKIMV